MIFERSQKLTVIFHCRLPLFYAILIPESVDNTNTYRLHIKKWIYKFWMNWDSYWYLKSSDFMQNINRNEKPEGYSYPLTPN